jgi:hypothetical protein
MHRDPTTFEWHVYADATFAGLSALIPFPLVDLVFEQIFKRRMAGVIARQRQQQLSPAAKSSLNRLGCSWQSCLLFIPWLFYKLLTRLSRKILYFLAVKEAVDNLNYYWHRAFLIDYMLWAGHLDDSASPERAVTAMRQTLASVSASPLTKVAQQVVHQSRHVLRTLWRVVRRAEEDELVAQEKATLRATWDELQPYLRQVADRYDEFYAALEPAPDAGA